MLAQEGRADPRTRIVTEVTGRQQFSKRLLPELVLEGPLRFALEHVEHLIGEIPDLLGSVLR